MTEARVRARSAQRRTAVAVAAVRVALPYHVEAHQARRVDAVRAASVYLRCVRCLRGGRAEQAPRSGIAVRFPRMLRWRRDKPVAEADTLQALRALSPSGGEGLEGQSPATASRKLRLFIKCRTGEISIHFSTSP